MKRPVVAIVGRPNVGKSTLFNRIIKKRKAIVDSMSGLTRDRHYESTDWDGTAFDVVDTGGYVPHPQEKMDAAVREQVEYSIQEAHLIIFVVDVMTGITDIDKEVSQLLLKSGKPVIPVVNKVDNEDREFDAPEFYKLGFGEPVPVSAIGGRRAGDLLDKIVQYIGKIGPVKDADDENEIKMAVVGKPNVGKSSFINALLQTRKMVVTDIPGTTRDAIDSFLKYKKMVFRLIDTAGLRKGTRGLEGVEYYSGIRALQSIDRSDIIVMMVDAQTGIERQDKKIMAYIIEKMKSMLIVYNKWDLVADEGEAVRALNKDTAGKLKMYNYFPSITISALEGRRVFKVLDMALDLFAERNKRVKTSALNEIIRDAVNAIPPNRFNGKKVDIKYCAQVETAPPVFVFSVNEPMGITPPYRRYLEKHIRQHFGFAGVPLSFKMKRR